MQLAAFVFTQYLSRFPIHLQINSNLISTQTELAPNSTISISAEALCSDIRENIETECSVKNLGTDSEEEAYDRLLETY